MMPALPHPQISLNNEIKFFSQEVTKEFILPKGLGPKKSLEISFEIDETIAAPSLRKVYQTQYGFEDLLVTIEIYHFNQNGEKYFSQQIYLYKQKNLVAKCTSYFPESQGFLVPGVCSGVAMNTLWGLSIYKK